MAEKYYTGEHVEIKKYLFEEEEVSRINGLVETNYPIIYILHNAQKKSEAYIGQSVNFKRRMKQHLKDNKKKSLKEALMISHERLNVSATLNIETNLINYFIAEQKYVLQNKSQINGVQSHNYYRKELYNQAIFGEIWRKLQEEKLVQHSIEELQNRDTFKISPFKELSPEQEDLKEEVLEFCKKYFESEKKDQKHKIFFIKGDAGTGKSVVLSSIFNTLQELSAEENNPLSDKKNYLLVNHSEMLKTYKKIADSLPSLKKKDFLKPTSFINGIDKGKISVADITLVDEAHLLLSTKDSYNSFNFENQLEEIAKRSKITIAVFDDKQVLKLKSYWNGQTIEKLEKKYDTFDYHLTTQFRMNASSEIVEWVDGLVDKKLLPFPAKKNEEYQNYGEADFDLKIFSSAENMRRAIKNKNDRFDLSRVVATFDYVHKKDGGEYLVEEGDFSQSWNQTDYKNTWAEEKETIDQVGSIYTVQGFDLNYVGVILGPSVQYDEEKDEIKIDTTVYKDTEAFRSRPDIANPRKAKEQIILNSMNVLLKRGIKGLYIFASNENLRRRLIQLQKDGEQN